MEWVKEYVKNFVSEDQIESFVEGFNKEFPKHAVIKSEFNKRGEMIESLTGQLEGVNRQVTELKEKGNPNEELKSKLDNMTSEFEKYKQDASKREKQYVMKDRLKSELGKSFNEDAVDLLLGTFNLEELTTNEAGDIVDLESKIGKLKAERPNLVKEYKPTSPKPKDRTTTQEVDTSQMTDEEYYAWKAKQSE